MTHDHLPSDGTCGKQEGKNTLHTLIAVEESKYIETYFIFNSTIFFSADVVTSYFSV